MYRNLEAEIVRKNLSKKDMAKAINKTYHTLTDKIAGKYPFTYDEAVTIQEKFFPNCEIKQLFHKTEEMAS